MYQPELSLKIGDEWANQILGASNGVSQASDLPDWWVLDPTPVQ